MPRKVKRDSGCTGSTRRSRSGRRKRITFVRRKSCGCGSGSRKRRQSRKRMRGGFNEEALQKVLDDALNATSGGALSGARLNGGQGGGSRRRTKRARRSRRSMRGGMEAARSSGSLRGLLGIQQKIPASNIKERAEDAGLNTSKVVTGATSNTAAEVDEPSEPAASTESTQPAVTLEGQQDDADQEV